VFDGKTPETVEFEYKKKDGTDGWGEVNPAMIETDTGRKELLIFAREISERKSFENTLIDSNKDLEYLVESRTQKLLDSERLAAAGRIAGLIAHDLRGPLQNIKAGLYLLNQNPADVDAYRMIDEASDLASRMLKEIRDHTSESPLILVPTKIGVLTSTTLNAIMPPENIKITLDIEKNYTILIDPNKINRVLDNLMINAIDAMPNGGKATVKIQRKNEVIQIQVIDNGIGVRDEDKRNLLKAFNTTKSKGMGLGLVYCKQAIEAHHGTISIDSNLGKGTTVTISLPLNLEQCESQMLENIHV